jgi:N-acetylmuramoyl-L-alanine amidase
MTDALLMMLLYKPPKYGREVKSNLKMKKNLCFNGFYAEICAVMYFSRIQTGLLGAFILSCILSGALYAQPSGKNNRPVLEATEPLPDTWLTTVALPNETVSELLSRFGLIDFRCNVSQFCKINKVQEKQKLRAEAVYKLPVLVYTYNGKSIRTTLGIADWKVAKRIEEFNRWAVEEGLRSDNFIVSKKLWTPWHEFYCPDETSVPVPKAMAASAPLRGPAGQPEMGDGKRAYPIFGKRYAKTPLASSRLKGKVFYLVSGHGGPDVGAQGRRAGHTLCEDEYAYDVTLRLLRQLLSHGATVYMIVRDGNDGIRDQDYLNCDKDETVLGDLEIPYDQKERLMQRTELINDLTLKNSKAGYDHQTLIEIHVDSRSEHMKTDVFFYYRPESEDSKDLAMQFHKAFLNKYQRLRGQRGYNGTVTSRSLFMLKETTCPRAVYIELGNIRNAWDQQRLVMRNNRQAIANWLCEVLLTNP